MRISNPKLHQKPVFSSVPLVLTSADEPAATECECQNRDASAPSFDRRLLEDGDRSYDHAKTPAINIGAKSRDDLHGRPVQSRGWLPLPTCQNKGFPRVLSPLTRRQSWLTSGYQRGFWSGEIPADQGLKTARKRPFWGQKAKRPPAFSRRAALGPKGRRGFTPSGLVPFQLWG